jgi:arylsulfatase A-like enzyme
MGSPYVPQHGFDYWVPDEHGHTTDFWDMHYIEEGKSQHYDGHATEFWTNKAIEFLRDDGGDDQPFFLYLSYNAPYGDGFAIGGEPRNPFGERFSGKPMDSLPREPVSKRNIDFVMHWSAIDLPGFDFSDNLTAQNNLPRIRNYFSQISYLDDGVGKVIETLKELGLEENTLVIFTADHGISMGRNGVWGVSPYAFPAVGYRQCFNIPMIVRHPGRIDPEQLSDLMVMQTDWYRTLLDYIGLDNVEIENSPGRSLASVLDGEALADEFAAAFYEQEEMRAIRTQEWAYFKYFPGSSEYQFEDELYDLINDPGEDRNVAADPENAQIVRELSERIDGFFSEYSSPKYDLWNGGVAMAYYAPQIQALIWRDAFGADWKPEYPKGL